MGGAFEFFRRRLEVFCPGWLDWMELTPSV
jgi:hypothetical protein